MPGSHRTRWPDSDGVATNGAWLAEVANWWLIEACKARKHNGEPCRAPPLQDGDFCFGHSPGARREAAEARKLGGQRRRRESTLAGAYESRPSTRSRGIRRVLEIVTSTGSAWRTRSPAAVC